MAKGKKQKRTMSLDTFKRVLSGTSTKSSDETYDALVRGDNHYDKDTDQIVLGSLMPRRKPGPKPGSDFAVRALTGLRLYTRPARA